LVELNNTESGNYRAFNSKKRPLSFLKAALAAVVLLIIFAAGYLIYNSLYSNRTLAVLPIKFENYLPEKEYLAEDLTQSIISKLSNLSDLQVKNRTLVVGYDVNTIEPHEAGKRLNVDAVFVGIIKNRADGMFLETKIIRTSDGVLIDPSFEIQIDEKNLIGLPEEIALHIINKIETKLTDEDRSKLAKKDTESTQAKNYYLEGRFYLKKRNDSNDLKKAIEAFTNAKDIDQNYAKAWAGLADAYLASSSPGIKNAKTPETAVRLARISAKKAVELDNTLAEAYHSLALISSRYEWNWREAESYLRMAISRAPEFLPSRLELIRVFSYQARYDEALKEAEKIKEIDPLSISSDLQIAIVYYKRRDYQKMDSILSELNQRFPNDSRIKYARTYQFLKTGRFAEAAELMEPLYKSEKTEERVLAAAPLGFAYAKMGRQSEALKIINDLDTVNTKDNYVPSQEKALIYLALGDFDKVFENNSKSCEEKSQALPGWITDPIVEEAKIDPRFAELKKCVNL
jgi:TolB-like protein